MVESDFFILVFLDDGSDKIAKKDSMCVVSRVKYVTFAVVTMIFCNSIVTMYPYKFVIKKKIVLDFQLVR